MWRTSQLTGGPHLCESEALVFVGGAMCATFYIEEDGLKMHKKIGLWMQTVLPSNSLLLPTLQPVLCLLSGP